MIKKRSRRVDFEADTGSTRALDDPVAPANVGLGRAQSEAFVTLETHRQGSILIVKPDGPEIGADRADEFRQKLVVLLLGCRDCDVRNPCRRR